MKVIKAIAATIIELGSIFGCISAFFFLSVTSNTKYGKQLRKDIYNLVEKGRRNE